MSDCQFNLKFKDHDAFPVKIVCFQVKCVSEGFSVKRLADF